MITEAVLNTHVGHSIGYFCKNRYTSTDINHCAHYVSHVLNLDFGATCRILTEGKSPGANVKVQQLFARCQKVGPWADRPGGVAFCLVFVTRASNVDVASKFIENVRHKHVGIYLNGSIWHYSNHAGGVKRVSPDAFKRTYPTAGTALYFGSLPAEWLARSAAIS